MTLRTLVKLFSIASLTVATQAFGEQIAATGPTAQDNSQIEALISPMIAGLKANHVKQASADYFNSNPNMAGKSTDVEFFGVQAEAIISAYGPIRDCQLIQNESYGSWAQTRLFICQHERFLSRWIFTVVKTAKGWQAGNLFFDDKFTAGIEKK